MDFHRRGRIVGQHSHQAAIVEVLLHEHAGHVRDADAFERSRAYGQRAVGAEIAGHAQRRRAFWASKLPFVREQIVVGNAVVRREVGRLVVQTTAAVAGKVMTAEDQRRLTEETAKQLTSS